MIYSALTPNDAKEFCRVVGIYYTPALRGLKGTIDGDAKVAVGFDNWCPNSCHGHVWIKHPKYITKKFIQEFFKWVYVTCDIGVVIGVVLCNNTASLRFTQGLGFKEVCRIPDGYDAGTDAVIQVMRREDCRWLPKEDRCPKVPPPPPLPPTTWELPRNRVSKTRH